MRLILLNGPPGSGKSTLARRFADEHPLTLNLDVDRVRDLLGGWRDDRTAAGVLARGIALAAARTHLAAGHDVVVPQFLGRLPFVLDLAAVAEAAGAPFVEVALMDSRDAAVRRFAERTRTSADPAHREAGRGVSAAEAGEMYDRLLTVIAARPGTRIVPSVEGDVDGTYRALLATLAR
ncbi:AAA family ATPase [Dactylosporangium sp. NPDC051484]|uniref:AAA family ATPase n=1 Tax=Dactylosporangium sp. NPDC051484 TaxID=3154942 RepID=UPI00344E2CFD